MYEDLAGVLIAVGPRLRALRRQRDLTLAGLSAATGISVSTLSRLESGQRRPNLELLLPLARREVSLGGSLKIRPRSVITLRERTSSTATSARESPPMWSMS